MIAPPLVQGLPGVLPGRRGRRRRPLVRPRGPAWPGRSIGVQQAHAGPPVQHVGAPHRRSARGLGGQALAGHGDGWGARRLSPRAAQTTGGPASPSLRPNQERTAPGRRDAAPLRLPGAHRGGGRCARSCPEAWGRAAGCVSLAGARLVREADAAAPHREAAPRWSALRCLRLPQATMGSPPCPRHPCARRPRSQPPVVAWTRAWASPRRRPAGPGTPSAFPRDPVRLSLWTTTGPIAGRPPAACGLVPSSFVRPLLGWHAACTPDLLARRESGGTGTYAYAPTG
jgi:hypothetical protein